MENNQLGSSLENSFVDQIVADIRKENALGDSESRRHRREKIVLPTFLYNLDGTEVTGFTRDLSVSGVSIISNRQFQPQETWKIDLYRLDGSSDAFFSECRWSKPFGESFWVSGWQFLCFER